MKVSGAKGREDWYPGIIVDLHAMWYIDPTRCSDTSHETGPRGGPSSVSDFFAREIERLKRKDSYRWLRTLEGAAGPRMLVDGREVIVLCSSNYLGLATHPRLKAAAIEATDRLGVCSAASRLIAGNNELYHTLEEKLAALKEREAAIVYSTGYMANLGVISAVVGEGDVVYADALSHASIIDGCRLSRAAMKVFPHNDLDALEDLLMADGGFR